MLIRIIDVDGASAEQKLMNDMSMRDRSALRQEMLRVDAGIDTTVDRLRLLRHAHPHPLEAEPGFYPEFACKGRVFPAYGGLHWGFSKHGRCRPVRREFVEALERQLAFEREEMERRRT